MAWTEGQTPADILSESRLKDFEHWRQNIVVVNRGGLQSCVLLCFLNLHYLFWGLETWNRGRGGGGRLSRGLRRLVCC
jgi:hypothetical protein